MNISLEQLMSYTTQAVEAGIHGYIQNLNPRKDKIKQSDAKRLLESKGISQTKLKEWVDLQLLNPQKTSSSRNAAVWYSIAEIEKVICSVQLKKMYEQ